MVTRLVGGHVALDLANTLDGPRDGEPGEDYLATVGDLEDWARRAGVPGAVDDGVLDAARRLRAAVYAVFRAVAAGEPPDAAALAELAAFHADAVAGARLVPAAGGFDLAWDGDVLAPVAVAAVDLLRRGPLERVKACAECRWLFLDTSRNHSRRWCSMNECGGRLKMRRYRARRRATEAR